MGLRDQRYHGALSVSWQPGRSPDRADSRRKRRRHEEVEARDSLVSAEPPRGGSSGTTWYGARWMTCVEWRQFLSRNHPETESDGLSQIASWIRLRGRRTYELNGGRAQYRCIGECYFRVEVTSTMEEGKRVINHCRNDPVVLTKNFMSPSPARGFYCQ